MRTESDSWHTQETYKSMMDYGKSMLQFCFLTNGAAIVSVLTFVGNLSEKRGVVPAMGLPMILFVSGLLAAGVAGVLTYMVQFTLFNEATLPNAKGWASHVRWLKLTLGTILVSMTLFAAGALFAISRLQ